MLESYLNLFVKSAFVENIALAYFLGMCSFLACSKKIETAAGLGAAVIFVVGVTTPINHVIHRFILANGALGRFHPAMADVNLEFLTFLTFIGSIAATVQIVEMAIERYLPRLAASLGVFLPLIAVNCAILGGSLFMVERKQTFGEATVYGLGAGVGWALAIIALASIRERLSYSDVPKPLRGLGITFIITGLMAIGFMAFAGIRL